jgi:malonyl-CoA/methylmalonyl-CoA synthetase
MSNLLFEAIFERGVAAAPAIRTERRTFTYADLTRESAKVAGVLIDMGVEPGDRVAAQIEKSAAGLILYLASVRAGAAFLPLNPSYTPAELGYFIADAEPRLIVADPARREAVTAIAAGARVETLDGGGEGSLSALAAGAPERFDNVDRGAGDLAAICYTSGTTGRSKGAMLSHGNLASNAATLRLLWRFTADDVLIHALPIYHVHGLFVASHVALMAGASMILQPRFDADAVLAAMASATSLMGVPTFYTRLLAHPGLTREATVGMRLFVSGSAPLLVQTHDEWRRRTGHAILERYGLSETGMNSSNPYDGERRPGTVGLALPDVSLRIADRGTGTVLPAGEVGVVEVKGPNVFRGYWRNRGKTAQAFRPDGFFITGDLGVIDERGYLTIVGRDKDIIITGGLNVYPKEVEAAIDAQPGVKESAVIGLAHADLGEAVTAVVVGESGSDLAEGPIIAALGLALARFKQPKRVVFVSNLPRNAMGKVQKALLRERYADLYAPPTIRHGPALNDAPNAST